MRHLLIGIALLCATACTTVESTPTGKQGPGKPWTQGLLPYNLPRAYLTADVVATRNRSAKSYKIIIYAPILVPDERYPLVLQARLSPFADDNLAVKIDPQTGLLQSINIVSEDRTDDILPALNASINAVETDDAMRGLALDIKDDEEGETPVLLARVVFDPLVASERTAANSNLCKALNQYYGPGFCATNTTLIELDTGQAAISGGPTRSIDPSELSAADVTRLCRPGVCVPTVRSIRMTVSGPNMSGTGVVAQVPDVTRLARIDFKRAAFVKRETQATFSAGLIATVATDKPSEVMGLVLIPINIVRAGIGAVSEVIQLRINLGVVERKAAAKDQTTPMNITQVVLPTVATLTLATPPTSTQSAYVVPTLVKLAEAASTPAAVSVDPWNANLTAYVVQMDVVAVKDAEHQAAVTSGDATRIRAAKAALRASQAAANQAAVAAKLPLPFTTIP